MSAELAPVLSGLGSFRRAVQQAYPGRAEINALDLDGTLAQAWLAVARLLGVSTDALATALAPVLGVPAAGALDRAEADALDSLSANYCQANQVLPLRLDNGVLVLATADPLNASLREKTAFLANRTVRWVLAPPDSIDTAVMICFAARAVRTAADQRAQGAMCRPSTTTPSRAWVAPCCWMRSRSALRTCTSSPSWARRWRAFAWTVPCAA